MPSMNHEERRQKALRRVAAMVTEALDLLDAHQGPPEAAAHIELALQKIRGSLR
jgi:hypothetical protein